MPVAAGFPYYTQPLLKPNFTGITLVKDSITNYQYIPKFSWVHYSSVYSDWGEVEVRTYQNAGYNESEEISSEWFSYSDANLTKNIEVPNGAIVSREFINTPYSAMKEQDSNGWRFVSAMGKEMRLSSPNTTVIGTYNNETVLVVTWDDYLRLWDPSESMWPDYLHMWDIVGVPLDILESDRYRLFSNKTPSWVEWAELSPSTAPTNPHDANYTAFTAEWNVPRAPLSHVKNARTNIFNGFTADGTQFSPYKGGMVQPILAWSCGDRNGKNVCNDGKNDVQWTGMAGTYYGLEVQKPHLTGKQIPISTGDTVRGSVRWDEKQDGWIVSLKDLTTGNCSYIVSKLISNKKADLTPVLTLENHYNRNICQNGTFKEEWPRSSTLFNNIVLKGDGGQLAPFDAKPSYNADRFTNPDRNAQCGNSSNYPQYNKPDHYYVDIEHAGLNPDARFQTHLWPRENNESTLNETPRPADTPGSLCIFSRIFPGIFGCPKPIENVTSAIVAAVTEEVCSTVTPSPKDSDEPHTNFPITGLTLVEDSLTSYHLIPKYSRILYENFGELDGVIRVATYQNAGYNENEEISYVLLYFLDINSAKNIEIPNGSIVSQEADKVNVNYNNETILVVTWRPMVGVERNISCVTFTQSGLSTTQPVPQKDVPVIPQTA